MSMNSQVRFHSPLGSRGMGVIYHLGVLNPGEPVIKTEEAVGLVGGAGLLGVGLMMKGKGGTVLSILGGLAALISGGFVAARVLSPSGPTVSGQPMILPPGMPAKPVAAKPSIVQQLAPIATDFLKLVKSSSPTSPAPGAIITTIPTGGGGGVPGMVTSYSPTTPAPSGGGIPGMVFEL